jgi:starch synthase (maltosyl-transferring)
MRELAKTGFTQSYTYFTWRNFKDELTEYFQELVGSEMVEYFRGNLFVNTPDILPEVLQRGGTPAFKMRAALAATLSPLWGVYSGFELCEAAAVPGSEEYAASEKYEIRVRNWNAPGTSWSTSPASTLSGARTPRSKPTATFASMPPTALTCSSTAR